MPAIRKPPAEVGGNRHHYTVTGHACCDSATMLAAIIGDNDDPDPSA